MGVFDRTASSTRLQMCCQSPWYPVKDGDLVMIASNFVSCYRCADEESDLSWGIFGWWWGVGGGAGFWAGHRVPSKQSRSQKLEARVLYSLIYFSFFFFFWFILQSHLKYRAEGGSSGLDDGGQGVGGGWGEMEEQTEWSSGNWTVSSAGEKERLDACKKIKKKKPRNSANKSASRSVDYCSSKLLQTDVDYSGFRVWALWPSQLAVIHLCATRGPQWASVRSGPPKNIFLQTDHRPPPQCKVLCCLSRNFRSSLGIFIVRIRPVETHSDERRNDC